MYIALNPYSRYRCLGVWDTVGALGLPEELTPLSKKVVQLFGFHDRFLGDHIETAYQALALNEMRVDFVSTVRTCHLENTALTFAMKNCTKFIQTEAGRRKNQTLKQVCDLFNSPSFLKP